MLLHLSQNISISIATSICLENYLSKFIFTSCCIITFILKCSNFKGRHQTYIKETDREICSSFWDGEVLGVDQDYNKTNRQYACVGSLVKKIFFCLSQIVIFVVKFEFRMEHCTTFEEDMHDQSCHLEAPLFGLFIYLSESLINK